VLPEPAKAQVAAATTLAELHELLAGIAEPDATVTALVAKLAAFRDNDLGKELIDHYFAPRLPRFFYFDDYSIMRGRVSIPHLQARAAAETLEPAEETFLALLDLVHGDLDDLANEQNFERLTRELEAAANGISAEVFEYWTQNRDLEVNVQISQANPNDEPPLNQGPILNVRIRNQRHRVTVPFDERSRGFVWFFSFLAYFSQLEREDGDLVLLLDEPGLNLHATAQGDLLRFIDERLAPEHQVIYTTHSPFMVEAGRLGRVRTVTDVPDKGTKVSADVFRTDSETVFPLQAALGYDLAQTLFVGPDCLLVEGPSDLIYLQLLSQALREHDRTGLDDRWVVVPVGGADKLSTFVSLLGGNQLNVAVLMDVSRKDHQRVVNLQEHGSLGNQALIQVGEITGSKDADIEDIFDPSFYLALVNGAYAKELSKKVTQTALGKGNPRIAVRVEEYFKQEGINGGSFSHYPPAAHFLREQAKLLEGLDDGTLDRAEALFKRVNALLA
jgi:hypothetical protein